jgi:hypothetical protein
MEELAVGAYVFGNVCEEGDDVVLDFGFDGVNSCDIPAGFPGCSPCAEGFAGIFRDLSFFCLGFADEGFYGEPSGEAMVISPKSGHGFS